ncbi:MAG: hypothetical protein JWN00_237 [Actinomycetia bacterium]|nr:hypothetical protein [Actinomycetes bacterium]
MVTTRNGVRSTAGLTAVLAAFGLGLPKIDDAIPDGTPLPPGTVLAVGRPGAKGLRPVRLTTVPGWILDTDGSSLSQQLTVAKDATMFRLSVVLAPGDPDAVPLWDGLGRLVPLEWDAKLMENPLPTRTAQGVPGLRGGLTGEGQIGIAVVFAHDGLGAEVVAAGPAHDFAKKNGEIQTMIRSIRFAGTGS